MPIGKQNLYLLGVTELSKFYRKQGGSLFFVSASDITFCRIIYFFVQSLPLKNQKHEKGNIEGNEYGYRNSEAVLFLRLLLINSCNLNGFQINVIS